MTLWIGRENMVNPYLDRSLPKSLFSVRGISPWQTLIPRNRTCYHVPIADEFCLCMDRKMDIEREYNQ